VNPRGTINPRATLDPRKTAAELPGNCHAENVENMEKN
jgi:zinc transporter 2